MTDRSGTFDATAFADELDGAPNLDVGTTLLFENDRVKVWEISLEPGQRVPFHQHIHPYFYVCVEPGTVRTRFANGYLIDGDEEAGNVAFMEHSSGQPGVHDLENIGETTVRYTTIELLR